MRTTLAATLLLVVTPLAGYGASSDATSAETSDCQAGIRFQGTTYMEAGYLEAGGERTGQAVLGECRDQGADPIGLTFEEGARKVTVWQLPEVEPDQAVARKTADGFQVFVSDRLDSHERTHILTQLGLDGRNPS